MSEHPFHVEPPVRVGVVGAHSVGHNYLPSLQASPFVDVVAVADIVAVRAEEFAMRYGVGAHYRTQAELLSGTDVDLVVNLTNMQAHGQLNREALLAGKHVWSEKPLAATHAEGAELVALAAARGVGIWGAPAVVLSPQFGYLAQVVANGTLGRLAGGHGHYGHLGPDWSAAFYQAGGGTLPDLAVYNLATLSGLLGPVELVTALTDSLVPTRTLHDGTVVEVTVEDNAAVTMRHVGGALSTVMSSFHYFDPHGHGGGGQDKPTVSLWGSAGSAHLIGYDWEPVAVDIATTADGVVRRVASDAADYRWAMGATHVAECLARGIAARIPVAHTLHVLEIIEAANRSAATGTAVRLGSTFPWPL
jgi:predicted dehydrogenase